MVRTISTAIAGMIALSAAAVSASADSVADFYKGKVVRFYVGSAEGGGMDIYARTILPMLSRHLPGQPTIIVQNMWGAGGVKVTRYVAQVAPRDGSALMLTLQGVTLNQVLHVTGVDYDLRTFNWIGRFADLQQVLAVRHDAPARTLEDTRQHKIIIGASGRGSTAYQGPALVAALLGARFDIIVGYRGADTYTALERGEIDGVAVGIDTLRSYNPQLIRDRKVNFLVAFATERFADHPNVPAVVEFARTDDDRRILELFTLPNEFGRAAAVTPGTPAARVAALRTAFRAAMDDPDYIALTRKRNMDRNYLSGEQVHAIVERIIGSPPEAVARARDILGEKK